MGSVTYIHSFGSNTNFFAGYQAGNLTTSSLGNTVIGYAAGNVLSSGNYNALFGGQAGQSLTTGTGNTYLGRAAGATATGGQANTAVGYSALGGANPGNNNTAVGYNAGLVTTGADNVFIGELAGYSNTSGSSNIFIGKRAGLTYSTTQSNQFIAGDTAGPINNVYFGRGREAAAPSSYTINGTGGSGTNIAGANLQLAGGKGTGNAAGGDILLQTSDAGATGAALQSLTTKLTVKASGNVGIGTTAPLSKLDIRGTDSGSLAGTTTLATVNISSTNAFGANVGPSLQFSGDNGTLNPFGFGAIKGAKEAAGAGFAGYLAFYTTPAGSVQAERVRIDSNGNVGIGTSTPAYKLDVSGGTGIVGQFSGRVIGANAVNSNEFTTKSQLDALTSGTAGAFIQNGNSFGATAVLGTNDANDLQLETNNSTKLTIQNSTGNVGIGTTAPAAKLDVYDSVQQTAFTGTTKGQVNVRGTTATGDYTALTFQSSAGVPGAKIAYRQTTAGGSLLFGTTNNYGVGVTNTALAIDPAGNVGIGTTAPAVSLETNGIVRSTRTGASTQYVEINGGDVSGNYLTGANNNKFLFIQGLDNAATAGANNGIIFRTNTTAAPIERLRIDNAGNVGIGTTVPGAKLQLDTGAAGTIGQIVKGTAGQTADLLQAQDSTGAVLAKIDAGGNLTVKNTAVQGTLSVTGAVTLSSTLTVGGNVTFNGNVASFSNNVRGINQAITTGATTLAVTFGTAYPDAAYAVNCTANYNTTCFVTGKATTGFTLNFGTAAPASSTVDWFVAH